MGEDGMQTLTNASNSVTHKSHNRTKGDGEEKSQTKPL